MSMKVNVAKEIANMTSSHRNSRYDDCVVVGILGGSVVGFILIVAAVTSFIYRNKSR